MHYLSRAEYEAWKASVNLPHDYEILDDFLPNEFVFRIPIGDYKLQLDYRIKGILDIVKLHSNNMYIFSKCPYEAIHYNNKSLTKLVECISASNRPFITSELDTAFIVAYMYNRWAVSGEGVFISTSDGQIVIYQPGNSSTLFVKCKSRERHDQIIEELKAFKIPAIGPHIADPLEYIIYEDIAYLGVNAKVNRSTGKVEGHGSEISVLKKCFLPTSLRNLSST